MEEYPTRNFGIIQLIHYVTSIIGGRVECEGSLIRPHTFLEHQNRGTCNIS